MKVMMVATQCGGLTALVQLNSTFLTRKYPKCISPSYSCCLRYANDSLSRHRFRSGKTLLPDIKATNRRCWRRVLWATLSVHLLTPPRDRTLGMRFSRSRLLRKHQHSHPRRPRGS